VYIDNFDDDVFAFELWLVLERTDIMFFQTDIIEKIDTNYWICEEYDQDSVCIDSVAGWPDQSWWKCLEFDPIVTDSCIDSIQLGPDDDWEWTIMPQWDTFYVDTSYPTVGTIDTSGSLISGWESVETRSFNPDQIDVKVTARSNVNFTDGNTPPPIPAGQSGGVLFRLLGDIYNIPDTQVVRDVGIVIRAAPADNFVFSRPNGTQIGLAYEPYVDTNCYRCEYWSGDECLSWKLYSWPPCDSIYVFTDSHPYIDTTYPGHIGSVVLDHGRLTVLGGMACGNVNGDEEGKINLADITFLISTVYLSGPPSDPPCLANTNCDAECKVNLADITTLIDHVYLSQTPLCEECCVCP
jgi:hypothetical protein